MRLVLANGCFDPLHYGHILHLRSARALGDRLVVALTTDEALRREKGEGRPLYPWVHRAELLRELRCVDAVEPSTSGDDAIGRLRPALFVKGIDYAKGGVSGAVLERCALMGVEVAYTSTPKLSASEIASSVSGRFKFRCYRCGTQYTAVQPCDWCPGEIAERMPDAKAA